MKTVIKSIGMFIAAWLLCVILLSIIAQPVHIAWRSWISLMVACGAAYLPFQWERKARKQKESESGNDYEAGNAEGEGEQ